ncbi:MAG: hypothetical protein ACO3L1_02220, partial [Flavobacteriaceae bacterium]
MATTTVSNPSLRNAFAGLLGLLASVSNFAQSGNDSIAEIELEEVAVTALRQRIALENVPAALTIRSFSSDYEGTQRSLQEYLYQVPGLVALNSSNYAQKVPEGFQSISETIPSLVLDLRYASTSNFTGSVVEGYRPAKKVLNL